MTRNFKIRDVFRLAAAITVICTAFTSCSDGREAVKPQQLSEDFSKTAEITLDENSYTANFKRGGADIWQCEFTSPDTIAGLKLTCSGEECQVQFEGLSYNLARDELSDYAIAVLISESVDSLIAGKDLTCTQSGETITECGIVNGEDFTAEIVDGELKSLQISQNFTAEFK